MTIWFERPQPSVQEKPRAVPKTLPNAAAEVKRLLDQGDLLLAFDRASEHLRRYPDSELLKHSGVLALVRAGATDRAARLFREWGLDRSSEGHVLALEARIAKDRALKLSGDARREGLADSAAIYRRIYEAKPDYYPAINWASLAFLSGNRDEAHRVAEIVLADPKIADAEGYWALATRAEANLILDRQDTARADIAAAASQPDADAGARSSTRRQLRLILTELGIPEAERTAFLAPLAPPPTLHVIALGDVIHFAKPKALREARTRIKTALSELRPGAVFASLCNPPEILFAEAALAAGAELDIVLPMADPAAAEQAIASLGANWAKKFRSCCRKARRVVTVAEDATADGAGLADYAARVAMGLALLRAQHLDGEAVQVLLDGSSSSEQPKAIRTWRETGGRQISIPLSDAAGSVPAQAAGERRCCALVFGDLPGFSKMPEKYLPIFWDQVMGAIGEVIGEQQDSVALKNTWGDAIHLVIPDVRSAAKICLAVQRRLQTIDGHALGRNEPPTMRIGAHYGPVFEGWDPVAAHRTYYGRALSRAARIEPITPPGTVYVTEAFAAILLLESRGEFTCTYVGEVPLAKGFGTFRMYDLAQQPGQTP